MKLGIVIRLLLFFATITLLVALIGWTAHTSWQRTGDLQTELSKKQQYSFEIADHLQQGILGLNNLILRYAISEDAGDWTNFTTASADLGKWFSDQQSILIAPTESPFLQRIDAAYTEYLAAADSIHSENLCAAQVSYAPERI